MENINKLYPTIEKMFKHSNVVKGLENNEVTKVLWVNDKSVCVDFLTDRYIITLKNNGSLPRIYEINSKYNYYHAIVKHDKGVINYFMDKFLAELNNTKGCACGFQNHVNQKYCHKCGIKL